MFCQSMQHIHASQSTITPVKQPPQVKTHHCDQWDQPQDTRDIDRLVDFRELLILGLVHILGLVQF